MVERLHGFLLGGEVLRLGPAAGGKVEGDALGESRVGGRGVRDQEEGGADGDEGGLAKFLHA